MKQRLRPELAKFTGLMMLTFTIDPELFETPQAAHEYVRRRRCIAVAMQRLDRWGLLHSRRYICVIEWQQNGWPHWHVLVDASHIPFEKLCEAWNRNWKGWRERVSLGRPGFGSVRFSVAKFKDHQRAAGYVTAYLTKHPAHGYPGWINDMQVGKVRRFEASRGFWSTSSESKESPDDVAPNEDETAGDDLGEESDEDDDAKPRRTIGEQLASCGKSCVVLRVRERMDDATGEVVAVREFVGLVPAPLSEFLRHVQVDEVNARGTVAKSADVAKLVSAARRWGATDVTPGPEDGILRHRDLEAT